MSSRFRISALTFSLRGADAGVQAELERDWAAFRIPPAADHAEGSRDVVIECQPTGVSQASFTPTLPQRRPSTTEWILEGEGYLARADLRENAHPRHVVLQSPAHRFPLEATLRVLLGDALVAQGGLLVHGVAVAWQGRAALFTGDSGAGKSTLGQLSLQSGLTLISDELVGLVPTSSGGYRVEGTPWNVGSTHSAELRLMGILRHARHAELTPFEEGALTQTLFRNMLVPDPSPAGRLRIFQTAARVVSAVPRTAQLAFALNPSVGDVLREALRPTASTPAWPPSSRP